MFAESFLFIFLFLLLGNKITFLNATEDTVVQVHVAFRHGDRVIDENEGYPTDPNKDLDFYPFGRGQLTNRGKLRAYNLGKMLRRRYQDFLGDIYDPEIVHLSSTDYDRTKMSALLVIAGLFPPTAEQQWNSELLWQPIPYNFLRNNDDTFIKRPNTYCPTYMNELTRIQETEGEQILKDYNETIAYIENNSGLKITKVLQLFHLRGTFYAEESMNLTQPEWVKNVYPEPVSYLGARQCYLESANTLLKRLNGGNFLRKYITNARQKIDGVLKPKNRKIYLYSGHDTNAINVLVTLGIWDEQIPPFSAAHIFELVYRNTTEEYGVKIYYHNDENKEPQILTVPGCESFCPFDKFVNLTEALVPKNYTAECGSNIDIDTFPWE